jgi:transposase
MDARQQRGLLLAATANIVKAQRGAYYVPSASRPGTKYRVEPDFPKCDCPDFLEMGLTCKHLWAVKYTRERERNADGTVTETETLTVSETVETTVKKRTTYKQDWPKYNAAQSVEKDRVQELLFDLCRGVAEPERAGRGRKPHTYRDSIFTMVYKVYCGFSARRFSSDLREAHARGFLSKPVPGMKSTAFMEDEAFTPILHGLVHASSLPLRGVETCFAVDSSGFGSNRYEAWYDHRYGGKETRRVVWVKCHIGCGVKTNIVTACRILEKESADSPQFEGLVKETAQGFTISEVSADKAYSSYANFETVAGLGGEGFLAFRLGTTAAGGGALAKMFHYFQYKQEEFLQHYHKRSNVESVFSAVKRKFGGEVRSKTDVAMKNEVLCKLIAHNLCVLVQEQHELGIEPLFWQDRTAAVCNGNGTDATELDRFI